VGAEVQISSDARPAEEHLPPLGEDGLFEFTGLAPGTWRVRATLDDAFPGSATVEVTHGPVEGVEIRLEPAGAVEGIVVDAEGAPVPRAAVEAISEDGSSETAVASRRGEFRISPVRPGRVVVRWRSIQRRRVAWEALRREHGDVTVLEGATVEVRVSLPRLVRLEGRLRVSGAAPEHAGTITLAVLGVEETIDLRHDAEGDFQGWVEPGTWILRATDSDDTSRESPLVVPEGVGEHWVDVDR
jgi:hypothetical protein